MILKHARNVTFTQAIWKNIQLRLDVWGSDQHQIMVEKTQWSCENYLTSAQREYLEEKRARTYTRLVLRGKLWDAVHWMKD